mgnify:CR=1 FL=1
MIDNLILVLISITILFAILLTLKQFLPKKYKYRFCAICLSVSLTWMILLTLFFFEIFTDKILIAILMGQTSIGLFYMFNEKLSVFKLPFILSLISLAYFALEKTELIAIYLILALWILFFAVHFFRKNPSLKSFANKLIKCCRNW